MILHLNTIFYRFPEVSFSLIFISDMVSERI
jgi:hypothetical protein